MSRIPTFTADEWRALMLRAVSGAQGESFVNHEGEEALDALATLFERLDLLDHWRARGGYFLDGAGATRTTGSIRVTWAAGSVEAHGLAEGSPIVRTPWGLVYVLAEPLEVAAGAPAGYQATVAIRGEWPGLDYNTLAELVDEWAWAEAHNPEALIDWTIDTGEAGRAEWLAGTSAGEITFDEVTLNDDGADGALDLLAESRGAPRAPDESDRSLAYRARSLPDAVTWNNIEAALNALLEPYGVEVTIDEWVDYGFAVGVEATGAIGLFPTVRPRMFIVEVPNPGTWTVGLAVGADDDGAVAVAPIGSGDPTRDGIVAGLRAAIDERRVLGVYGRLIVEGS